MTGDKVILVVILLLLKGCSSQAPEGIHHCVVVVVHCPGEGRVLFMESKLLHRHFLHRCESNLMGAALLCKATLVEHGLPLHCEVRGVLAALSTYHTAGVADGAHHLLGISITLQVFIIMSHIHVIMLMTPITTLGTGDAVGLL